MIVAFCEAFIAALKPINETKATRQAPQECAGHALGRTFSKGSGRHSARVVKRCMQSSCTPHHAPSIIDWVLQVSNSGSLPRYHFSYLLLCVHKGSTECRSAMLSATSNHTTEHIHGCVPDRIASSGLAGCSMCLVSYPAIRPA